MRTKVALAIAITGTSVPAFAEAAPGQSDVISWADAAQPEAGGSAGEDQASSGEPSPASDSGWEFAITPYVWVAGLSGHVQIADLDPIDVDNSFSNTLSKLKFALMVGTEARHSRFVMLGDIIYLNVGAKARGPREDSLITAKIDSKSFLGSLSAGYRVVDNGPLYWDVLVGGRLTSLDEKVTLSDPTQSISRKASKTSLAPLVATRFRAPLGERWGLALYGDVGGFGITSDLSWQLMGTIQYDLGEHWRLAAGYRHGSVEYDRRRLDVHLKLSGPIMGISYRF